jgi:hypothetical protein
VRVRGYDVWKKDYDESNETVLHSVEDWSLIGESIGFQRLCAEFREHRVLWEGLRVGFDNATMLSLSFTLPLLVSLSYRSSSVLLHFTPRVAFKLLQSLALP